MPSSGSDGTNGRPCSQEKRRLLDSDHSYSNVSTHDDDEEEEPDFGSDGDESGSSTKKQKLVETVCWQTAIGGVILGNSIVIGFETEMPGYWLWPPLEDTFLLIFCIELSARLATFGLTGFFDCYNKDVAWNLFDFAVVVMGVSDRAVSLITEVETDLAGLPKVEHSSKSKGSFIPMIMRTFRLLRILRVFRIFKILKPLYEISLAIFDAAHSVLWVSVVTILMMYICAVMLTRLVGKADDDDPMQAVKAEYFGSIGASCLTLFQLMAFPDMDRFASVYRDMPCFKIFLIVYIILTAFAMMSVLIGVVTETILIRGAHSKEARRFERERVRSQFIKKARAVLKANAGSDHACISRAQFNCCKDEVLSLMDKQSMDLCSQDLDSMFDLVDFEGSGIIEVEELLYAMVQLSAELRPMSIMELRRTFVSGLHAVNQQVKAMDSRMQMMDARLKEALSKERGA
eukprot:TRINITY_DN51522_c0_g1_i1.p1 TRINITY_DN51522_c0_g1~~TRINITY_DN51522_c0_g1_i1.p1  ORF type:complete len:459 (-),score=64.12 TRINITY_DN51522_c0_g1_i1:207-1583(-)